MAKAVNANLRPGEAGGAQSSGDLVGSLAGEALGGFSKPGANQVEESSEGGSWSSASPLAAASAPRQAAQPAPAESPQDAAYSSVSPLAAAAASPAKAAEETPRAPQTAAAAEPLQASVQTQTAPQAASEGLSEASAEPAPEAEANQAEPEAPKIPPPSYRPAGANKRIGEYAERGREAARRAAANVVSTVKGRPSGRTRASESASDAMRDAAARTVPDKRGVLPDLDVRRMFSDESGRPAVERRGIEGGSRPDAPSAKFRRAQELEKNEIKSDFLYSNRDNVVSYCYLSSDPRLGIHEVSVGVDLIATLAENPGSGWSRALFEETGAPLAGFSPEDLLDPANLDRINAVLRASGSRMKVEKFPVNSKQDAPAMYVQIHEGRGIRMHPTAGKVLNADLDGDQARVDWRLTLAMDKSVSSITDLLVSPGGRVSVDEGFFDWPDVDDKLMDDVLWNPQQLKCSDQTRRVLRDAIANRDMRTMLAAVMRASEEMVYGGKPDPNFLRKMRDGRYDFSKQDRADVDWIFARIYGSIYSRGKERKLMSMAEDPLSPPYVPPIDEAVVNSELPATRTVLDLLDICAVERRTLNYADLQSALNSNLEFRAGNSYSFRITTDIAKLARESDKVVYHDDGTATVRDEEGMLALYDGLLRYQFSRAMSGASTQGERDLIQKRYLREQVIMHDVAGNVSPLHPKRFLDERGDVDWKSFCDEMMRRYDNMGEAYDSAMSKIRWDGTVVGGRRHFVSHEEEAITTKISRTWEHVFGDKSVESLFEWEGHVARDRRARKSGKPPKWSSYASATCSEFAAWNDFHLLESERRNPSDAGRDGAFPWDDTRMLKIIGDRKTSEAGEFNRSFNDAVAGFFKTARRPLLDAVQKNLAWELADRDVVRNATDAMFLLGPEMFGHLGLDNPRAWLENPYARALIKSETQDRFKDNYARMQLSWRFERLARAESRFWDAVDRARGGRLDPEEKLEACMAEVVEEIERLSSASPIYAMIVETMAVPGRLAELAPRAFVEKTDGEGRQVNERGAGEFALGRDGIWCKVPNLMDDVEFVDGFARSPKPRDVRLNYNWLSPEKAGIVRGADNLLEVLSSDALSWADKENLLCDLMKVQGHVTTPAEVMFQLTRDPLSAFGSVKTRDRDGYSDLLQGIRDGRDQFAKVKYKQELYVKEVEKAIEVQPDPTVWDEYVGHLDRNGLVSVPREMGSEAMLACLEPTYDDSEKSKHDKTVLSFCAALTKRVLGTLFSDYTMMQEIRFGWIRSEDLARNPQLIVKLLANPDMSIRVRSADGVRVVNRDVLAPDGIVKFMQNNPRLAQALCPQMASPTEEGAFSYAVRSLSDAIASFNLDSPGDRAWNVLCNHAGLYACAAALVNPRAKNPGDLRDECSAALRSVIRLAAKAAVNGRVDAVLDENGVVEDVICDWGSRPPGVTDEVWDQKVERVLNHMAGYAYELAKEAEKQNARVSWRDLEALASDAGHPVFYGDEAQLRWAEVVEAKLFSAKTTASTGANGAMSQQLGAAGVWLATPGEPCGAPPRTVSWETIKARPHEWVGMNTRDGRIDWIDIDSEHESGVVEVFHPADCRCGCKTCSDHMPADGSSSKLGSGQLTPLALLFQIVRQDSTEKLNLKFAKVGFNAQTYRKAVTDGRLPAGSRFKAVKDIEADLSTDAVVKESLGNLLDPRGSAGWQDIEAEANRVYLGEGRHEYSSLEGFDGLAKARMVVADHLGEVYRDYGYDVAGDGDATGLTRAQLLSIAHSMVVERTDGDGSRSVTIVSVPQICDCISDNLTDEDLAGSLEEQIAAMDFWAGTLPEFLEDSGSALEQALNVSAPTRWPGATSSFRQRLSSPSRSAEHMLEVLRASGHVPKDPSFIKACEAEISKKVAGPDKKKVDGRLAWAKRIVRDGNDVVGIMDLSLEKGGPLCDSSKMVPGAKHVVLVTASSERIDSHASRNLRYLIDLSRTRGITVVVDPDAVAVARDLVQVDEESGERHPFANGRRSSIWGNAKASAKDKRPLILNMFDLGLVGESRPYDSGLPAIGSYHMDPKRFVTSVLETCGEHPELNDSNTITTKQFNDTHRYEDEDVWGVSARQIFGDTWSRAKSVGDIVDPVYSVLSRQQCEAMVNQGVYAELDLGVRERGGSDKARESFDSAYAKWAETFATAADDMSNKGAKPGDIVAWALMTYRQDGVLKRAVAPIRPYAYDEGKAAPARFDLVSRDGQPPVYFNPVTGRIEATWRAGRRYRTGDVVKVHEDGHGANKLTVSSETDLDYTLPDGTFVGNFAHIETTIGRRGGSLQRDVMDGMVKHMRMATAYTTPLRRASSRNPLPDAVEALRPVLAGEAKSSIAAWRKALEAAEADASLGGIPFYAKRHGAANHALNRIVRNCVDRGVDPMLVLSNTASKDIWVEYSAVLDSSDKFMQGFAFWMNDMWRTGCPPDVKSTVGGEHDQRFMYSFDHKLRCFVMQRPCYTADGTRKIVWEPAVVGRLFPSEGENTILKKPTILKSSGSPSNDQVLFMSGYKASADGVRRLHQWRNVKHVRDADWGMALTMGASEIEEQEAGMFEEKKEDVKSNG